MEFAAEFYRQSPKGKAWVDLDDRLKFERAIGSVGVDERIYSEWAFILRIAEILLAMTVGIV